MASKRDKKQNSDSVDVLKRSHHCDKTEKRNLGLILKTQTNIKNFKEPRTSKKIISSSTQTTPFGVQPNLFFRDALQEFNLNRKKSSDKNLEDIFKNIPKVEESPVYVINKSHEESEEANKKNESYNNFSNLPVDDHLSKNSHKKEDLDESLEKKDLLEEISQVNDFNDVQNTSNSKFVRPNAVKRSCTMINIQTKFVKKEKKPTPLPNKGSKYMAVINLFKKNNKLESNPVNLQNFGKKNRKKKKNRVQKSPLQKLLRRSSVEVFSPLTSPEDINPNSNKNPRKSIFKSQNVSVENSPSFNNDNEKILSTSNVMKTQQTIMTLPSTKNFNKKRRESKILIDKINKGEEFSISSSSESSNEESLILKEEDFFKGYYSDTIIPSSHWNFGEINKNLK